MQGEAFAPCSARSPRPAFPSGAAHWAGQVDGHAPASGEEADAVFGASTDAAVRAQQA